jgi:hypothetical protein
LHQRQGVKRQSGTARRSIVLKIEHEAAVLAQGGTSTSHI